MANMAQKFIYNITTSVPLLIVFSIAWYLQTGDYKVSIAFIIVAIILLVLFIISFSYAKKHLAPIPIRVNDISPNDGWIIGYIISYLLPLCSIAFEEFTILLLSIISLAIILILPLCNSSIPHPLLFFAKYHFFQVSGEHGASGYVLISKRKLRRNQDLKTVYRIFEFMLIDSKE